MKNIKLFTLFLLINSIISVFAQNVGIGTSIPNSSSKLDIQDANRGLLIPRVVLTATNVAAPVTTPAISLLVYNTNTNGTGATAVSPGYYYWDGIWVRLNNSAWLLNGNVGTNDPAVPATYGTSTILATENFLGTTDANDVVIGTNNIERFRIKQTTGNVGIGIAAPIHKLDIQSPGNTLGVRILSGNANELSYLSLGRTYEYAQIGATTAGTFFTDALDGDMAVKNFNTGKLLLGASYIATADMAITPTYGYVGVKSVTPASRFDINGDLALREGPAIAIAAATTYPIITLTTGAEYSHYRLTGATIPFWPYIINGGNDGQIITLINATGQPMNIYNYPFPNGIITGTGNHLTSTATANSSVTMIFNATLQRWIVTGYTGMTDNNDPDWHTIGNAATNDPAVPATYGTSTILATENWAGTTDANDYVIGTNRIERLRVKQTTGNIGIGTASPTYRLHITDPGTGTIATYSQNTYVGNSYGTGVYGVSQNNPGYGYGGQFLGGYTGVYGDATVSGAGSRYGGLFYGWYGTGTNYGSYNYGYGGATSYGVYGIALGATTNIGGYFYGSNYGLIVPSGGGLNGFGTTAPTHLVDVIGAGGANIHVRNNGRYWSNSASGGMWMSDLQDCFMGNLSTTQFGFWSSSVGWNALNINKTTNQVAIGTTTPAASRLEVADASINPVLVARIRNGWTEGTQIGLGSIELSQDWQASLDWQESVSIYYGATPGYNLQMGNNSAAKPTNGSWTVASDARLKDDVHPFKDGLSVLRNIKPVYFHYNGKAKTPDEYGIGVIAQQVKEVAPYMVSTFQYSPTEKKENIEEYYSYNPDALHYITLNAVKELDEKVQQIEENISDFGVATLNEEETFISFNKSFKGKINKSEEPVVTATLLGKSDVVVNIISQNSDGFLVRITDALSSVKINWIAMAKAEKSSFTNENYTTEERKEMLSKVKLVKGDIIDNFEKEEAAMKLRKEETDNKRSVDDFNAQVKASEQAKIAYDKVAAEKLVKEYNELLKENKTK